MGPDVDIAKFKSYQTNTGLETRKMQLDNLEENIPQIAARDREKIHEVLMSMGLDEDIVKLIAELSPIHSMTGMAAQTYVDSN